MVRLKQGVTRRWSALGRSARLWWTALGALGLSAALVLSAASIVDATSHPSTGGAAAAGASAGPSAPSAGAAGSNAMPGMHMDAGAAGAAGAARASAGGAAQTSSTTCPNVKGTTVMADGMVMAPVPSGPPTAAQQAAADQLVAETKATLTKYASLTAATAAGYVPATRPSGRVVHYANWQAARSDGFDPSNPAFLVYANTVKGPLLLGAMYLGPGPCQPGPDVGGSLTQWHAHDNLCLAGGRVVGRTATGGSCTTGTHNTSTYFMLHVWVEPALAATHQFQADVTRAEIKPIILGQA